MKEIVIQKKRIKCVSCDSRLSEDIVMIGDQYPSAIYFKDNDPLLEGLSSSSLNLARCTNEDCNLVQLSHEYDLQYVFDHYPYESGSTATMKQILQDVVNDSLNIVKLNKDDVVLDIGGNDGTMLGLINMPLRAKVNIDAAAGVKQIVKDSNYKYIHSKYTAEVYNKLDLPNPKLITCVAMFYHLSNPLEFCRDVKKIMSDDTVWVIQMTYLGTMLNDNIYDNIVHEHAVYYSLSSLEFLLSKVGLHIAEARIVKSYGGSLRVFVVKNHNNFPKEHFRNDYYSIVDFENQYKINSFESLYAFNSRVQLLNKTIRSIIDHIIELQGPIYGFGASTKGNMILQLLGISSDKMIGILDNNKKKIGTYTTGTMIPIIEEDKHIENLPEYLFVLPYYYKDAFVNIIQKKLKKGQKVNLFIPLPYPHFISVKNEK